MMTNGVRHLKVAAHRAAARAAVDMIDPHENERRATLEMLTAAGFPRCLIDEDGLPEPTAGGRAVYENGESWTRWWLYSRVEVEAFGRAYDPRATIDEIVGFPGYERHGAGRVFWDDPHVRVGRNHVLVTQHGGFDV